MQLRTLDAILQKVSDKFCIAKELINSPTKSQPVYVARSAFYLIARMNGFSLPVPTDITV